MAYDAAVEQLIAANAGVFKILHQKALSAAHRGELSPTDTRPTPAVADRRATDERPTRTVEKIVQVAKPCAECARRAKEPPAAAAARPSDCPTCDTYHADTHVCLLCGAKPVRPVWDEAALKGHATPILVPAEMTDERIAAAVEQGKRVPANLEDEDEADDRPDSDLQEQDRQWPGERRVQPGDGDPDAGDLRAGGDRPVGTGATNGSERGRPLGDAPDEFAATGSSGDAAG